MENTNTSANNEAKQMIPQQLPNSTAVLVLGILSIVMCWCIGIAGLVMGIIALVLAGKSKFLYEKNPGEYTIGSYKNLNAGKICAIIGTSLSGIYFIYAMIKWIIVGGALMAIFSDFPWDSL